MDGQVNINLWFTLCVILITAGCTYIEVSGEGNKVAVEEEIRWASPEAEVDADVDTVEEETNE